ncbi:MAG: nitroreductase [Actinobacteria bacterium]|nr:nitroreductase [Actinomycetota bacterium]
MTAIAEIDLRPHALRIAGSAGAAPSLHNAQPWALWVDVGAVQLWADPSRRAAVADPDGRQMTISLGAALYSIRLELAELGLEPVVELLPDRERPDLVAVVTASGTASPDPALHRLWAQLPRRRTVRDRMRAEVAATVRHELTAHVNAEGCGLRWLDAVADRRALATLAMLAERTQQRDPRFLEELAYWVGAEALAAGAGVPGYALGPAGEAGHAAEFPMRDFGGGRRRLRASAQRPEHHPVVAVLTTGSDGPRDWLRAGEALMRLLLAASGHGLAASYLNQPLEHRGLRAQVRTELALSGHAQLVLRLGRPLGPWPPATPRRPPAELLRDS